MEPQAWESDEEMGGDDVDVTRLTVESTQGDASEGLEATPSQEDVRAVEEAAVWRAKVRGLQENSRFWVPYHRNAPVWAFFRLIEGSMDVHIQETQVMRCMISHPMPSSASTSSPSPRNTINKKGILQYNPSHGSTSMLKHLQNEHEVDLERYKAALNEMGEDNKRQKSKKRKSATSSSITEYFGSQTAYRKTDLPQLKFLEDLVLFVAKGYVALSIVENNWLRRLVMQRDPRVRFPSRKQLSQELIPGMLAKTMQCFVLPALSACATVSITFDLWMSRTGFDTFTMVVNFVDDKGSLDM